MPDKLTVHSIRVLTFTEQDTLEVALELLATAPRGVAMHHQRESAKSMLEQKMHKRMLWAAPVTE